ncbi:MAG: serine protease [Planctomycetota bacterium]
MQFGHDETKALDDLLKPCLPSIQNIEDFLDTSKTGLDIRGNISVDGKSSRRARINLRDEAIRQKIVGDVLLDLVDELPVRKHELLNAATYFQRILDKETEHYLSRIRELADQTEFEPHSFSKEQTSLEGIVSRDPFLRMSELKTWCDRAERRVCRVRIGNTEDDDNGTGFLIDNDLVLTCFHVVEKAINEPEKIFVHFDGTKELMGLADGWTIPHSQYSDADEIGGMGEPSQDELDFAVLKLAESVGTARSFFRVNEYREPREGEPIVISGHPGPGAPLQELMFSMAAPGFEQLNANGTRMIYKTSTENGSSGSPVFDRRFRLIGLHQNGGEKGTGGRFKNNRGIPLNKILSALFDADADWATNEDIVALKKN